VAFIVVSPFRYWPFLFINPMCASRCTRRPDGVGYRRLVAALSGRVRLRPCLPGTVNWLTESLEKADQAPYRMVTVGRGRLCSESRRLVLVEALSNPVGCHPYATAGSVQWCGARNSSGHDRHEYGFGTINCATSRRGRPGYPRARNARRTRVGPVVDVPAVHGKLARPAISAFHMRAFQPPSGKRR